MSSYARRGPSKRQRAIPQRVHPPPSPPPPMTQTASLARTAVSMHLNSPCLASHTLLRDPIYKTDHFPYPPIYTAYPTPPPFVAHHPSINRMPENLSLPPFLDLNSYHPLHNGSHERQPCPQRSPSPPPPHPQSQPRPPNLQRCPRRFSLRHHRLLHHPKPGAEGALPGGPSLPLALDPRLLNVHGCANVLAL